MIGNRYITAVCCFVIALAVAFTALFMSGILPSEGTGVNANVSQSAYVGTLFDTSYVHSLNINVDDEKWQEMLDNATAEEYISCDVTIDGTALKNVAIRPKGNTSLSNVQSYDSERYSFKIKFNKYDEDTTYNGLDKLALNNIIQDNTYMKDYFSYRMMAEAGAEAPLCSFIYIKVNNEDWGLYLAVEAVDEAFAERNYGSEYGEIYKPESMAMGGGMGEREGGGEPPDGGFGGPGGVMPQTRDFDANAGAAEQTEQGNTNAGMGGRRGGMPENGGQMPEAQGGGMPENGGQMPEAQGGGMPEIGGEMPEAQGGGMPENGGEMPEMPGGADGGRGGGPGGMGNNTVALVYQDDDPDSYSAIFDYSVFDIDESDKKRLINSIKQLNEGENLEDVLDVDEVLRYFAAHNFTVNSDSYTGNMMHNYYLHEKDGKMSMIAWDYNLAFGGMGGGMGGPGGGRGEGNSTTDSAAKYVNYPIDTPLFSSSFDARPMIGKLLENEEYMALYHEVFDEFIANYFESGDFENEYNRVFNTIAEYVRKDPTKFCTFDEFLTAADTLKQFCLLRAESVRGQLNGTIPSTDDGQSADASALIDASGINVDAMGDMGMGGGRGERNRGEGAASEGEEVLAQTAAAVDGEDASENNDGAAGGGRGNDMFNTARLAEMLGMDESGLESMTGDEIWELIEEKINTGELNMSPRGDRVLMQTRDTEGYILIGGSLLLIVIGIIFAAVYKRRRI